MMIIIKKNLFFIKIFFSKFHHNNIFNNMEYKIFFILVAILKYFDNCKNFNDPQTDALYQ